MFTTKYTCLYVNIQLKKIVFTSTCQQNIQIFKKGEKQVIKGHRHLAFEKQNQFVDLSLKNAQNVCKLFSLRIFKNNYILDYHEIFIY